MCTVTILVHDGIGRASFNVGVSGVFRAGMVGGVSLRVAGMLAVSFSAFSFGPFGLCIFWCLCGCNVGGGGSGIGWC